MRSIGKIRVIQKKINYFINKKENSYIKEIVNISYLNKQNSYIFEKGNIEKNQNFNPRNNSKNKIDIPNYLKSMTYNYIRNDK